ncbi:MAG: transketolase [Nitrospirae bacterium]|nr:transketolase [Magnetococcales bacterium]HAT51325.1 transketolase [Alphaproteobacteria bacterium]
MSFGPFDVAASKKRCRQIRRRILEMSRNVAALHVGGAFSCTETLDTIYYGLMRRGADGEFQDSFILSKGHAAIALYAILEQLRILDTHDIETYCTPQGRLGAHPDRGLPGIEASTGSLGHGLGMASGMALHDKVFNQDRVTYVVMSDGELQEGSVWEMVLHAPALGLNSLVAFVDYNNLQSLAYTSDTHPNFYPITPKLEAFGWEAVEVDGHDQKAVFDAVTSRSGKAPFFVVCKTIKGKGVSYMENQPVWHFRSPNDEEFQQAMQELAEKD